MSPPPTAPPTAFRVDVFFDDEYVSSVTAFDTTRKAALLAEALRRDPVDTVRLRRPAPADREDLARIHDAAYIDAVITGQPSDLAESGGLGWDSGFVAGVLASTGGCIAAARAAWENGVAGSLSSGLHHAHRDHGSGYCTINGVALAALTFLDLGAERVLVLDLDAHCGGGTVDILGADARITQIDVSTDRFDHYQPSRRCTLDVIDHADHYLPTIAGRLSAQGTDAVDAVVYNAGMDPHQDCSIGGLHGIDDEVLAERERLVFDWAADAGHPIAFVLAGGYSAGAMGVDHLTGLHRLTVEAAARAPHTAGAGR